MKEAVSRKKDTNKAMWQNRTVENKSRHKSMKNKANEAVSKAMRDISEDPPTEFKSYQNRILRLIKEMKTEVNKLIEEDD